MIGNNWNEHFLKEIAARQYQINKAEVEAFNFTRIFDANDADDEIIPVRPNSLVFMEIWGNATNNAGTISGNPTIRILDQQENPTVVLRAGTFTRSVVTRTQLVAFGLDYVQNTFSDGSFLLNVNYCRVTGV